VFYLVGILLGGGVHTLHASTLRSTMNTSLSGVDVVVKTIEETSSDHSRKTLEEGHHVLALIDLTRTHRVLVQSTHSPANGSPLLSELRVEPLLTLGNQFLVGELLGLGLDNSLLGLGLGGHDSVLATLLKILGSAKGRRAVADLRKIIVLNHSVVGDDGTLTLRGWLALEQKRTLDGHPPLDRRIPQDNPGVNVGNEEDDGKEADATAGTHGDGCDVPSGFLVKTELRRSLVDDGKCADGASNEEEERGGVDGPLHRVSAHVHNDLDEHEDGGGETGRDGRCHTQTSKDSTKTFSIIPAPLDLSSSHSSNTDTSDGRDQRVSRRNVSGVLGAPHDPGGSTSERTSESKHLDTSVSLESRGGNDTVLDGLSSTGTDSNSSKHFEDSTEDHGLAI